MTTSGDGSDRVASLSRDQRALLAIKRLKAQVDELSRRQNEPLAVVGIGCRFPGDANDPRAFWRVLSAGTDATRDVPADRWDIDALYDARRDRPGHMTTRRGSFVRDVDQFDPGFFGIAPREADSMDPQQRLLLEVSYEALEDAGLSADSLSGSPTGVFVGVSSSDYMLRQVKAGLESVDGHTVTGSNHSVAAGRVSYLLGLQGPSFAVDTACSSALLATHLACGSLRRRECDLALAGGVHIASSPEFTVAFSKAGMMAADGRCKTFDGGADGYVRGEGCGIVALRRLGDALACGDRIYALIRASATNQDGRTSTLTAPSGPSQQAVIRRALADGKVEPTEVCYIEAHGTGTPLGDPIETGALEGVFGAGERGALAVGSVKTNVGHLEAGAGAIGLIKAVLSLHNEQLPPHLNLRAVNPHVTQIGRLMVPSRATPWPRGASRRLAGVSSFAFQGSNVHLLVEEAPRSQPGAAESASDAAPTGADATTSVKAAPRAGQVLALSARTPRALGQLAARMARALEDDPTAALADVCASAYVGRRRLAERLALGARSVDEARARLRAFAAARAAAEDRAAAARAAGTPAPAPVGDETARPHVVVDKAARRPRAALVFGGAPADERDLRRLRQLSADEPAFAAALAPLVKTADDVAQLSPSLQQRLSGQARLDAGEDDAPKVAAALLACCAQMALAELWQSWALPVAISCGVGPGEIVAAWAAGSLSLDAALRLARARAQVVAATRAEQHVVLRAGEAALGPLGADVALTAELAAQAVALAGSAARIEALLPGTARWPLASDAVAPDRVEQARQALARACAAISLSAPSRAGVRWLGGDGVIVTRASTPELDALLSRLVGASEPPRWPQIVATLGAERLEAIVDLSATPGLAALSRLSAPHAEQATSAPLWLGVLGDASTATTSPHAALLDCVSALFARGFELDVSAFAAGATQRVRLPTYPFQRRRCWLDEGGASRGARDEEDPIVKRLLERGADKWLVRQLEQLEQMSEEEAAASD